MPRLSNAPGARSRLARRAALPALALSAALLGACTATGEVAGGDDPLVDEVYQAIRLDPKLGASQVIVENRGGGTVALNGFIENLADEQSVIDAAMAVDGVTNVESNLTNVAE